MASVTLRLGSPITRSPNAGLGMGSAPAPSPPIGHQQRSDQSEPPRTPAGIGRAGGEHGWWRLVELWRHHAVKGSERVRQRRAGR